MYYTNENNCTFEGFIISNPVLNTEDDKNVLELCISNKPFPNSNIDFTIHLRCSGQYALILYPQLSSGDKIYVETMYAPSKVLGMSNTIFPKFNISKLIILQKKLSNFKYEYKSTDI